MADSEQVITTNDLQRQITALGARMEAGFSDIKDLVRGTEARVRELETREAACNPMMNSRVEAAWRQIDEHKTQMKDLRTDVDTQAQSITQLKEQNKLLLWLVTIEGAAVITWAVTQVLNMATK